jgi:hypothetical protein
MPIEDVADAFFRNVPDLDLFACACCEVLAVWGEADTADVKIV